MLDGKRDAAGLFFQGRNPKRPDHVERVFGLVLQSQMPQILHLFSQKKRQRRIKSDPDGNPRRERDQMRPHARVKNETDIKTAADDLP